MSKRRKVASIAFTGAAAAAATGMGATHAMAASGWTITPGNGPFTGVNNSPATLSAAGIPLTCAVGTATAAGSVSGDGAPAGVPTQLATINSATFGTSASPCSVFGQGVTAKLTHNVGVIAGAATDSTGVTAGHLGNTISASINGVNGFACHMTVTGTSVPGAFHNASNALAIGPGGDLTITTVSGCLGLFTSGEPAGFTAKYTTSPALTVNGG